MGRLLFVLLVGIYLLDGGFVPARGAKGNVYLAVGVIENRRLSFTPEQFPFMFVWNLDHPNGRREGSFARWDQKVDGVPMSALLQQNRLTMKAYKYYVVPSTRPGEYLDAFGPGAGLAALPLFVPLRLIVGDLGAHPRLLWFAAKTVAAATVAGSAVLIFLTALAFTTRRRALLIALSYALGTCVWSMSSQALYQHGPNELFLALGAYFFLRTPHTRRRGLWAGLAWGAAVWCRPTSAIVLAAAGVYLLARDRRAFAGLLGGALMGLLLGAYDWYYLGSPFTTAHTLSAHGVASYASGSPGLWQTPLWYGALAVLFSPSRGLLIFSPFLIFAFAGATRAARKPEQSAFIAIGAAAFVGLVIAFKWTDWWGGWSYGYRVIVDLAPLLALLLIPVVDWVCDRRWALGLYLTLTVWSVAVQALGAFAYDTAGWNARLEGQTALDIDRPAHRARLWSIGDSQIVYYVTHFADARRERRRAADEWIADPTR